jgi:argininosuccinate lyase
MVGVLPPLLRSLAFDTRRMREAAAAGFSTATDLADYLVRKGLPFRQAHEIVGRIVRHALDAGKGLEELALDDLRRFSALFEKDAFDAVSLEASLRARAVTGGTAPAAVREALVSARRLAAE